jgi:hypothetical protein
MFFQKILRLSLQREARKNAPQMRCLVAAVARHAGNRAA